MKVYLNKMFLKDLAINGEGIFTVKYDEKKNMILDKVRKNKYYGFINRHNELVSNVESRRKTFNCQDAEYISEDALGENFELIEEV